MLMLWALLSPWSTGCERAAPAPRGAERAERAAPEVDAHGLCVDHGVPHELCTKCNPTLAPIFEGSGDWCPEHGFPESVCPVCHPEVAEAIRRGEARGPGGDDEAAPGGEELPSVGAIEGRVVRLASPSLEDAAGLAFVEAAEVARASGVECMARVAFDPDRVADVRALVPGVVRGAEVAQGASVEAGDVVFWLESVEVAGVQGELRGALERERAARADLARKRELRASEITSAREVELAERELAQARAEVGAAQATLRLSGASRRGASGRYAVRAPIAGQVVERPAVVGALATAQTSLATIVDTSSMWATCEVPEREAHQVSTGHALDLELGGGSVARGEITWISPQVDARTRTVRARASFENASGRLRANQLVAARATTGPPRGAVAVPRAAVQRVEGREVVFVRARAGVYLPRVVERHGEADPVVVTGELAAGERVVTDGAVLLRTEVMPGSIGAGCCEVPGAGGEE
jgi:cobalt-zinc-cadmium efflux system membrane fusion protein